MSAATLGLLFAGGVVAGFINIIAGGGSLITMPLLIFAGLPETSANGTARVALWLQNSAALLRYRNTGVIDWSTLRRTLGPVIGGAGAGALVGTLLPAAGFRGMLAAVTLIAGAVVVLDLPTRLGTVRAAGSPTGPRSWRLAVVLFACGFYGGMLQAGAGYLFLAVMTVQGGLTLVPANVLKIVFIWAYTPLVVAIFAASGHIDLEVGAALAAGQTLGGWLGAATAVRRGAAFIRVILALMLVATAIALIVPLLRG